MQRLMRNDAFALHVGKESSRRVVSNFHNRAGVRLCFAFEMDSSFTTAAGRIPRPFDSDPPSSRRPSSISSRLAPGG